MDFPEYHAVLQPPDSIGLGGNSPDQRVLTLHIYILRLEGTRPSVVNTPCAVSTHSNVRVSNNRTSFKSRHDVFKPPASNGAPLSVALLVLTRGVAGGQVSVATATSGSPKSYRHRSTSTEVHIARTGVTKTISPVGLSDSEKALSSTVVLI